MSDVEIPQVRDMAKERPLIPRNPTSPYAPLAERVRLSALEEELARKPLEEIAERFSNLTYGDMIALSEGIGADPAKVWEWCTNYGKGNRR